MFIIRTDIYDLNANGNIINSSEIAEYWDDDYEAAVAYLVRNGADENALRKMGICGSDTQSFSVCVWERTEDGQEWQDNCSEAIFAQYFGN